MNIIELAKEATNGDAAVEGAFLCITQEELHRFANLIIEECAVKCEQWVERYSNTVITNDGKWHGRMDADECAAAIREMKK